MKFIEDLKKYLKYLDEVSMLSYDNKILILQSIEKKANDKLLQENKELEKEEFKKILFNISKLLEKYYLLYEKRSVNYSDISFLGKLDNLGYKEALKNKFSIYVNLDSERKKDEDLLPSLEMYLQYLEFIFNYMVDDVKKKLYYEEKFSLGTQIIVFEKEVIKYQEDVVENYIKNNSNELNSEQNILYKYNNHLNKLKELQKVLDDFFKNKYLKDHLVQESKNER